jgi:predicted anti-sigma-YlaC factor YlaD
MTCKERIPDLVDGARGRSALAPEFQAHLDSCSVCRERWNSESQLSGHLSRIRSQTAKLGPSAFQRKVLLREFSKRRRPAAPSWLWSLAAAAAILMAVFIGHEAGVRARHSGPPAVRTHGIPADTTVMYEVSTDASALSTDDFVEVPYTPPLAPGEIVRMVHTQMFPGALANMGVAIDPSSSENFPVDMVVGEDGLPRAVRISENSSN